MACKELEKSDRLSFHVKCIGLFSLYRKQKASVPRGCPAL